MEFASVDAPQPKRDQPETDVGVWAGLGKRSSARLVITPEQRSDLRPLVDELLRRAPTLSGWSFHPHRLAESYAMAVDTVQARTARRIRRDTQWELPGSPGVAATTVGE